MNWKNKMKKVKVNLNFKNIDSLPIQEIKVILRGTDDLIMSGGRTLLAKILKGSKEKKIFELELNKNPVYGYFQNLKIDNIKSKIDWVIANRYLRIEYDGKLPLLVYTRMGWEI